MKKSDHQLLVEIHEKVMKEMPTKADMVHQTRTIVKTIRTCTTSEEDQNGPLNQVRRDQVNAVRRILFDAYQHKRPLTLSQACLEAWTDLKGGYPTPKALYNYCNEHKNLF